MKNQLKKLCLFAMLLTSLNAFCQVPNLNSYESAAPTIFLDFDGHTVHDVVWGGYQNFYCLPAVLTTQQITDIFNQVSEDYRPFAVNVSTDSTKYWAAPYNQRIRIIITPTSAWYPGVGGIAYVGSFVWGGADDLGAFVFPNRLGNNPKAIAEAISHESGHAVGLTHQAKFNDVCSLTESYNTGKGTGETSWAPIMGNPYSKNITSWNNGPTPYTCTSLQDNLSIITTANGFGYRPDDYEEITDNTTTEISSMSFNASGIITTNMDKDAFRFINQSATPLHIEVNPYNIGANNKCANLDIKVQLVNNINQVIRTYNPESTMSVIIDTSLAIGTYYLVIDGEGNTNIGDYGSLGSYTIMGSRGVLAIRNISLRGNNDGKTHRLNWEILADEPIATQVLETSSNGRNFEPIFTDVTGAKNTSYIPKNTGNVYYRLKATSIIGESIFSNIAVLKSNANDKSFTVTTLVQNEITVAATEDFQFKLFDANARLISSGTNKKGINNITLNNMQAGLYILQMTHNNTLQTERIIKQ
jgi:hypothetical protein